MITASMLRQAEQHPADQDADWSGVVRQVGPCNLRTPTRPQAGGALPG